MPKRIQRKRTKGWIAPEGAVSVTRPGRHGNPFVIGGYFKMGVGNRVGFSYLQCIDLDYLTPDYILIETKEQSVEWFRRYRNLYPLSNEVIAELRGKDLMCWCRLDEVCHADELLRIANE